MIIHNTYGIYDRRVFNSLRNASSSPAARESACQSLCQTDVSCACYKILPVGIESFFHNKKEIRQSVQQTNFYRVQSFHKIKHLFIHFNALLGNKYFGNQTKSEEDLIPLKKNEKSDFVLQNNNLGKTTLIALVSYLWLICSA